MFPHQFQAATTFHHFSQSRSQKHEEKHEGELSQDSDETRGWMMAQSSLVNPFSSMAPLSVCRVFCHELNLYVIWLKSKSIKDQTQKSNTSHL